MKVLVTGGAGFIGSHIVKRLLQKQCEVVVIDDLSTGSLRNLTQKQICIQMDIRSEKVLELCRTERFDAVIHLAAQTMVPASIKKPVYDCEVNIAGTLNILEAARQTGVKRVIFSSTAAVYGNVSAIPVKEHALLQPTSFYGLSKLTAERYLQIYSQLYGIEHVILRYANVYGERQGDFGEGGVISIFLRKIYHNMPVIIFGDGGQTRDFVYAGDVAEANYLALQSEHVNTVYNIGTQTETSVNALLDILETISQKPVEREYNKIRAGDIYRSSLCSEAAAAGLYWKAQTTLEDGLIKTYAALNF
ncbi:NAD-dependent epimerase/dehydratase family protein [Propionispora sp. 2/2-37]|uniref:NAD-dependent epimerase/dehydratase family protein n=1 Tax=Propionispora sp. 2/2-37 TaxID=1677858 RepID=UPI0006BB8D87|nr:NAD-dependent epimerase/dehydratase family protein [Propionispora sp. 2/2-37]